MTTNRIPVLLDTDPGSDVDDAIALSYLLSKPECELVGVTTVTGDTARRAAIVEILCRAAGRTDVPIVAGRSAPLAHGQGQPQVPHYEAVRHLSHRLDYAPDQAVDFLRRTIRERPGEIVLLSVGPLANIALLFALDPEIPSLLKGLVSMAGSFGAHGHDEWNCVCDPTATSIVAHSARPDHVWIGLDVTLQCTLGPEEVRQRFQGPLLSTVLPMAEAWLSHSERVVFHDPLAAATVFCPELCRYETGTVRADGDRGSTFFEPGHGRDRVATAVEAQAFFDEFWGTVGA